MSELTLASLHERIGRVLGVSDWEVIDQARIDTFASCTGDRQWIHVDVERAKRESPFRGPIAHGYLTLAMVAPLAMQIGVIPKDAAAGLNYGIDKVRFLAPVPGTGRDDSPSVGRQNSNWACGEDRPPRDCESGKFLRIIMGNLWMPRMAGVRERESARSARRHCSLVSAMSATSPSGLSTRPSVMGPMMSSLPSERHAAELMLLSVVNAWPPHHAVRGSGEPI